MVTKTRELIESEHDVSIQSIRASHLDRQEISHEEYHDQLNAETKRYNAEIALHFPPEPPRDLAAEIDELKARLDRLQR